MPTISQSQVQISAMRRDWAQLMPNLEEMMVYTILFKLPKLVLNELLCIVATFVEQNRNMKRGRPKNIFLEDSEYLVQASADEHFLVVRDRVSFISLTVKKWLLVTV